LSNKAETGEMQHTNGVRQMLWCLHGVDAAVSN